MAKKPVEPGLVLTAVQMEREMATLPQQRAQSLPDAGDWVIAGWRAGGARPFWYWQLFATASSGLRERPAQSGTLANRRVASHAKVV